MTRPYLGVAMLVACSLRGHPAPATTLSGIVIHAADDFGNPSGLDWDMGRITGGQIWRTAAHPQFGLGIAPGLPAASLSRDLLNESDMSIRIDLVEGENDFTFFAQWGPGGNLDERYVLNCFFDGEFDRPALSVLFPLGGTHEAAPPQPTRADVYLTFDAEVWSGIPDATYTNGSATIDVREVHFLPPDAFREVDKIAQHTTGPGDGPDLVGVLRLVVQPIAPPVPESVPETHGMQGFRGEVSSGPTALIGPDLQGETAAPKGFLPPADTGTSNDAAQPVRDQGEVPTPPTAAAHTPTTPMAQATDARARRTPTRSHTARATTPSVSPEAQVVPTLAAPTPSAGTTRRTPTAHAARNATRNPPP